MDVQAFKNQFCLPGMTAAGPHRQHEHLQVAGHDQVRPLNVAGQTIEVSQRTDNRNGAIEQSCIMCAAKVDDPGRVRDLDWILATPKADDRDCSPAKPQHADAAMDGRVGQIVDEVDDFGWH
jgi:hypothetical protein